MNHLMQWRRTALRAVLMLTLAAVFQPASADAGAFSAADLKRMSTFVSNFAEARFPDFDMKAGDEPANLDLIRFGIRHNYINNAQSRFKHCLEKSCTHGSMSIDAKFVAESVKKYFDLGLNHRSSPDADSWPRFHFDGARYHFEPADGDPAHFAKVTRATKEGSVIRMTGDIYSEDNSGDPPEIIATFVATAKPHKWNGKDTWAILSLKTEYR
ncbi:MAG: hypothetical protein J6T92_08270 [Ottowia sp.]|nr:hypothetical protein [Ottowia sp.]